MVKKIALAALSVLILTAVMPANLAAQTTYAVTPSKLEISAGKGETVAKTVDIVNKQAQTVKIKVYVMDYKIRPDNSFVFSPPGTESYSAAAWIELKKTAFAVPAGATIKVPFQLKVPSGAEVGGHYAVIFFENAQKVKKEGIIRGRIGSLVMVTVGGQVNRGGKIAGFSIANPWYGRDVGAKLVFSNPGNVHLTTRGEILFFDSRGRQVGREDLGEITALPNTRRLMRSAWKNAPAFGRFKAVANVYYGSSLSDFGVKKSAETSLLILPLWQGAALLAALALAFVIFLSARNQARGKARIK